MDERLIEIERKLWEKIRERQAEDSPVRNGLMHERFQGRYGVSWAAPGDVSCLIGMYGSIKWLEGAMSELNITGEEASLLEHGFEDWSRDETMTSDPFYRLARRIGQQLEDDEAAAHAG